MPELQNKVLESQVPNCAFHLLTSYPLPKKNNSSKISTYGNLDI